MRFSAEARAGRSALPGLNRLSILSSRGTEVVATDLSEADLEAICAGLERLLDPEGIGVADRFLDGELLLGMRRLVAGDQEGFIQIVISGPRGAIKSAFRLSPETAAALYQGLLPQQDGALERVLAL